MVIIVSGTAGLRLRLGGGVAKRKEHLGETRFMSPENKNKQLL